jgi:hypothetical protein
MGGRSAGRSTGSDWVKPATTPTDWLRSGSGDDGVNPFHASALSERAPELTGPVAKVRSMHNVIPLPVRTAPQTRPEPLWREAVGEQLRAERTDRDERIADVATRAGVAPQYLSELERGLKDPSSEVLSAVAGALGLPVLELTRRASHRLMTAPARLPGGPVCLAA